MGQKGVLLLNSSLMVERSKPAHNCKGWETFTDLETLNKEKVNIVIFSGEESPGERAIP